MLSRPDNSGEPITAVKMCHVPPPIPGALDAFEGKREKKTKKASREGWGEGPSGLCTQVTWEGTAGERTLAGVEERGGHREKSGQSRSLSPHLVGEVYQLPRWFMDGMTCLAVEGP